LGSCENFVDKWEELVSDAFSDSEAPLAVNRPAELQLARSHSVEQAAVCSARRQSLTEHVHTAAEDLSVWTVTKHTRRRCDILWF